MKYTIVLTLLWALALMLTASYATADVPKIINYQGRLTDTGGDPLPDTTLNITFSLYRGDDVQVWTSGPQSVQVTNGIFNYGLGSNVALTSDVISGTYSRYLGIKVGDDAEIVPKTQLISTPYAYKALDSDTASYSKDIADNTVTGDKIVDGSINLSDIGQNGALADQVIKWNGSAWVVGNDETGSGAGDITAVYSGSGLDGGGTEGDVTLSIGTGAIVPSHIATNAIQSDAIAPNAVGASEIANDAVGASEIGVGVVYGAHIADNAITQPKIAQNAVTSYEIATGAVGSSEIATDAVNYLEITAGAVRSDEILDGTILDADINASANIATDKISGTAVNLSATQTITGNKTFDGTTNFGDSTIIVDGTGIRIGRAEAPVDTALFYISRNFNSAASRYGSKILLENSGTGSLYGLYSNIKHTSSSPEGWIFGLRSFIYSDTDDRFGVQGVVYTTTDSLGTGRSVGVSGTGYGGQFNYGVKGYANNPGGSTYKYGVYGQVPSSTDNYGVYSFGNLHATGTNTKGGGGYKIDHPQDPGNMYLTHSDVSSPEMMNIYNGNVTTDGNGEAVVDLPNYFESLNTNFRYQLTVVGSFAQAIINDEIKGNVFTIKTDKPYVKVSWMVTGIRKDAFAKNADLEVETAKSADKQGRYQNPELFGFGIEKAVDFKNYLELDIDKD